MAGEQWWSPLATVIQWHWLEISKGNLQPTVPTGNHEQPQMTMNNHKRDQILCVKGEGEQHASYFLAKASLQKYQII